MNGLALYIYEKVWAAYNAQSVFSSETRTVQRTLAARELYVSFPMKPIREADLTVGQLLDIAGSFERKDFE